MRQALPFKLTGAQESAIADVLADMASADRMLRLLQGDVGSGKTMVALFAAAAAIEAGLQVAMMAPTEILARQHYERLKPLVEDVGLTIALLTGATGLRNVVRRSPVSRMAVSSWWSAPHALFPGTGRIRDLALAIVDEQHRFGVHQVSRSRRKAMGSISS